MRQPAYSGQFKKDFKLAEKRVYRFDGDFVRFERTGTHADLFAT